MPSARSVMARKSVVVRLTPRQAMAARRALHRAAFAEEGPTSSRLYSAASAITSALFDDGWDVDDAGTWSKEADG